MGVQRESIFELPESFQHSPMNEVADVPTAACHSYDWWQMLSGGLAMMPLIILLRILLLLTEQPTVSSPSVRCSL